MMKNIFRTVAPWLAVGVLSVGLAAQTAGAQRYDQQIETKVSQKLADKKEFRQVSSSVEDGIVTLTGSVDVYQQKLDAAKRVRKLDNVQGVRNQIAVTSQAPDAQLMAQINRKLYYDRMGYDNVFNYVTVSVKDGVATLSGVTRTDISRDSAVALARTMSGVKDVVNDVQVAPASFFDDGIRLRATRAIYGDSVLSRYGSDPALPIRIVVENGHVSLYGTVDSQMDKQMAGIRANQVSGVFSVQNNLVVASRNRS